MMGWAHSDGMGWQRWDGPAVIGWAGSDGMG